jgi:hypothetical protein
MSVTFRHATIQDVDGAADRLRRQMKANHRSRSGWYVHSVTPIWVRMRRGGSDPHLVVVYSREPKEAPCQ